MKRSIPTTVAALAMSVLTPLVPAQPTMTSTVEAATQGPVAFCFTNDKLVTKVRWASGETDLYRNAYRNDIPFFGTRTKVTNSTKRGGRAIVACNARLKYAQIRLANGTKYRFTYPAEIKSETTWPPPPPVYVHTPPAKLGVWQSNVTLSVESSVEADWMVAEAAAMWQVEGLTVTTEPCSSINWRGCIKVYQADLTGETPYSVFGLAWQSYSDGIMYGCRIGLDPRTPSFTRPEIAAHEIGHCLGLPHWDTEGTDAVSVMSTTVRASRPTERDLAWLKG